jgi:hypothetical protein
VRVPTEVLLPLRKGKFNGEVVNLPAGIEGAFHLQSCPAAKPTLKPSAATA